MEKKEFRQEIGARIRDWRERLNLSREQFATEANISVPFLCDIENGKKAPSLYVFRKIATALNVSADQLIFGSSHRAMTETISKMLEGLDAGDLESVEKLLRVVKESFLQ